MARMKPERRAMGRSFVAGSIVLVVLIAVTALTFSAVNGMPFRTTTEVRAEFGNVHALAINDDVRQNSARIGRIKALQLDDGRALVTMELDGNRTIYKDAHAAIGDVSALAAKFVELDPGNPAAGPLGDQIIPAGRNQNSADAWQLLNVFEPKTRAQMASFLREFGGGSLAHGPDFNAFLHSGPALLHDVGTVSETMASPEFDLPRLIATSDTLSGRFRGREMQISALVRQVDETFKGFTAGNSLQLKTVLAKAPGTLHAVRPALDRVTPPLGSTRTAMTNLRPGSKSLGDATPDLRGFLRESVPVSHQVPGFSDDARPALGDLSGTLDDARPLVNRAADTFDYMHEPLDVLAPYGPEVGQWFTRMHSFVTLGAEAGKRYAHLAVVLGPLEGSSFLVRSDAKRFLDPYPKPGQAQKEHLGSGLPAGIGLGGSK